MSSWQSIVESLASVAVIVVPAAVAHYKKLGAVLSAVTAILESVQRAENQGVTNTAVSPENKPGSGMVNSA